MSKKDEAPAQPAKLKVTLEDRPIDIELAQYKRMFEAACSALGKIGDALGCDPEEGGAEPILAAIAELKAEQPAQQGWKLVPVEPTPEMIRAAEFDRTYYGSVHANSYRAMLNAAPQPAQQEPVARVDYTQRDGFHWLSYLGWQRIPDGALLYTSPPASKPWVGLKLADKNAIVRKAELRMEKDQNLSWRVALIEETEANLREKNA